LALFRAVIGGYKEFDQLEDLQHGWTRMPDAAECQKNDNSFQFENC
jgi:hypothetical protein